MDLDGVGVGWMRWRFDMWVFSTNDGDVGGLRCGKDLMAALAFLAMKSRTFLRRGVGWIEWDWIRCTCAMGAGVHVVIAAFGGHC